MRSWFAALLIVVVLPGVAGAQSKSTTQKKTTKTTTSTKAPAKPAPKPAAPKVEPAQVTCPSQLGEGVKTKRAFCDILTGRNPAEGIRIAIPPHVGTATLTFDLHNRHTYSEQQVKAGRAFADYTATIGVLLPDGTLVTRAAVKSSFRTAADLVDAYRRRRPRGCEGVAPVGTEPIQVEIPANVTEVDLLGEKLVMERIDGRDTFTSPGGRSRSSATCRWNTSQPRPRRRRRRRSHPPRSAEDPPAGHRHRRPAWCAGRVNSIMDLRDVVVVGAGPAACHGHCREPCRVVVRGAREGRTRQHRVPLPDEHGVLHDPRAARDRRLPFVTPHFKPTRVEALNYYRRVVDTYRLDVRLGEEVSRISEGVDPAGARVLAWKRGRRTACGRLQHGRTVVLATGAFDRPNLIGVPGEDLPHVSHYYTRPTALPHARGHRRGQNSAAEAALELHRAGVDVTLVHRGAALGDTIKYWVRPDIENRIKEGSVRARFETRVVEIRPTSVIVEHHGTTEELPADSVLLLTGYCSDTGLFERAGVAYDAATFAPRFDPETLESNVPGLFIVGAAITAATAGRSSSRTGACTASRWSRRLPAGCVATEPAPRQLPPSRS